MLLCLGLLVIPARAPTNKNQHEEMLTLILIQQNSIVAIYNPYFTPKFEVLGALIGEDEEYPTTDLMRQICQCESGDNPEAKNPNSGALGRCQFIPSTRTYVEKKWGIKIDWTDPDQQLYACNRLLAEEGCRHWRESANCHHCYE